MPRRRAARGAASWRATATDRLGWLAATEREVVVALNREKVGTAYPSYTYEVSREKIREYAIALGETDPRY